MSPAAQLAGLLATARERHQPFPDAWAESLQRVCWPAGDARTEWQRALRDTRHEFQNAYENPHMPTTLARLTIPATEQDLEQQIIRMAHEYV
jgi:hypothetical protein